MEKLLRQPVLRRIAQHEPCQVILYGDVDVRHLPSSAGTALNVLRRLLTCNHLGCASAVRPRLRLPRAFTIKAYPTAPRAGPAAAKLTRHRRTKKGRKSHPLRLAGVWPTMAYKPVGALPGERYPAKAPRTAP